MGIHINGDYNEVNVVYGDVIYGTHEERSSESPVSFVGLFIFFLFVVGLIIKFWWIILIAVGVATAAYAIWVELQNKRRAEFEAHRQRQSLAARAERQNDAYLQGDPWGMYGNFPPPPEVRDREF